MSSFSLSNNAFPLSFNTPRLPFNEMDFSKIICLLHYWLNFLHYREVLHYWLILLYYREVLHYREFITLLEQNVIIDIFQCIPPIFMAAI